MINNRKEKTQTKMKRNNSSGRSVMSSSEKGKKRDNKAKDKTAYETRDTLDFDDLSKNNETDIVQRTGNEWNEHAVNVVNNEANREGNFDRDEPEKIMGVVKQLSGKEWLMKVKWKKDNKSGKRPKHSIHTNTSLKKICPDLLFDFYESNVISNV